MSLTADENFPPPTSTIDPDRSLGWIRRFQPVLRGHRRTITISIAGALLGQMALMTMPLLVQRTIDRSLVEHEVPLRGNIRMMAVATAFLLVTSMISRFALLRTGTGLQYDLRALLQRHLGRQSFAYHDSADTGQLISRANSDIHVIEMFLVFSPIMAMMLVGFAFAVVVMLSTHVMLTLVAVASLPVVFILGLRMRQLTFPLSWLVQARTADIATIVEENLAGAHVVRAMAAERDQIAELDVAAEALRWAALREIAVRARYQPLMEAIPRLGQAAFILAAGLLAIDGKITIGTVVLFTSYLGIVQWPFRILGFVVLMAQRARAASGRVFEILDQQPAVQDRPGAAVLDEIEGNVTFANVTFRHDDGPLILDGLNLTIMAGEKVALVGRTASGKSTLANLVPRFYDVTAGRVTIDDVDVRDVTQASLRSHIGLVMDDAFLFTATIRDNIAFARPEAPMEDVVEAARSAGALDLIEELPQSWDTVVGERGYTLSGGQRQRISIARVLVQNPSILILDDATSAIDVEVERQIHDALEALLSGRTTLLIAHRPATIAMADRVALLSEGKIVAEGSHEGLLADEPRYAEVLAMLDEDKRARAKRGAEQARRQQAAERNDRSDFRDVFNQLPPGAQR